MSDQWVIVGLGNPGDKYAGNRHNVGFLVADILAARYLGVFKRDKSEALVAQVRMGYSPSGAPGPAAWLVKPTSFMNSSGNQVAPLLKYYGISAQRLLVIHDELDLAPHRLRLKNQGGEGGHNGLRSISARLGTRNYARLRVGVGRPPAFMDPSDYVLSNFPRGEANDWQVTFEQAADVATHLANHNFATTQQWLHTD